MTSNPRPLSPHLQVYRWQLTSVLSILHRASGVALAAGTILLVWWLGAASDGLLMGPDHPSPIGACIVTRRLVFA